MNKVDRKLKIIGDAPLAKGKKELIKYLMGGLLTLKESVWAYCFECKGYYVDGKKPCTITSCSLYPFMPYNPKRRAIRKVNADRVNNLKGRIRKIDE